MIDLRSAIGKMDRRITVKQRAASGTAVADSFGKPLKTFTDLFTCWAAREATSGSANTEQTTENRIIYPASYIYYLHYQSTVTQDMRMEDEDTEFDIVAVDPLEGKKFLALTVQKVIE